jgi:hypothetical protein
VGAEFGHAAVGFSFGVISSEEVLLEPVLDPLGVGCGRGGVEAEQLALDVHPLLAERSDSARMVVS